MAKDCSVRIEIAAGTEEIVYLKKKSLAMMITTTNMPKYILRTWFWSGPGYSLTSLQSVN